MKSARFVAVRTTAWTNEIEFFFCRISGEQNWGVQLRAKATDEERDDGLRRSEQGQEAAVLHSPLRELWINGPSGPFGCVPFVVIIGHNTFYT